MRAHARVCVGVSERERDCWNVQYLKYELSFLTAHFLPAANRLNRKTFERSVYNFTNIIFYMNISAALTCIYSFFRKTF